MDPQSAAQIKALFQAYDENDDGVISRYEMGALFRDSYWEGSEKELDHLIDAIGSFEQGHAGLNFVQFMDWLCNGGGARGVDRELLRQATQPALLDDRAKRPSLRKSLTDPTPSAEPRHHAMARCPAVLFHATAAEKMFELLGSGTPRGPAFFSNNKTHTYYIDSYHDNSHRHLTGAREIEYWLKRAPILAKLRNLSEELAWVEKTLGRELPSLQTGRGSVIDRFDAPLSEQIIELYVSCGYDGVFDVAHGVVTLFQPDQFLRVFLVHVEKPPLQASIGGGAHVQVTSYELLLAYWYMAKMVGIDPNERLENGQVILRNQVFLKLSPWIFMNGFFPKFMSATCCYADLPDVAEWPPWCMSMLTDFAMRLDVLSCLYDAEGESDGVI
eukprot:TRINITY_DN108963_c0_g1_i1.p1 TRINITY_DN108963_c0_g1~~TRINITY_DN108963_c0_g1_i1.p1  ORF type:complete len:386 (-),score=51.16 TRINITY_DN108963_c0_g1_i1:447-1604(-)